MKKSIKTLAAAAFVLIMAGAAWATDYEYNYYVPSDQYQFWNAYAVDHLTLYGCTTMHAEDTSKKHGITTRICPWGNDTIRISSYDAPFEPCRAILRLTNPDGCPGDQDTYGRCYRKMASSVYAPNTLTCQYVNYATSDVYYESLVQESHGQKYGPRGGGQYDVVFSGGDDACSYWESDASLIVPYGFFVNKGVTARQCLPPNATANLYEYCMTDADCGGASGACVTDTIKNITRLQAVNIFSGYISDWSDLGDYFTARSVTVCLRHAGSGAHATLDFAVVRGNGWGDGPVLSHVIRNSPKGWLSVVEKATLWTCANGARDPGRGVMS